MSANLAIAQGIYNKLTGGTALTALLAGTTSVYWMQAPNNATLPYVVFSVQGGGARNDNPHDTRDVVYTVMTYAQKPGRAGSVDLQVANLLHRGTLSVSGYSFLTIRRETEIELPEEAPNGSTVYAVGAMYRIMLDT